MELRDDQTQEHAIRVTELALDSTRQAGRPRTPNSNTASSSTTSGGPTRTGDTANMSEQTVGLFDRLFVECGVAGRITVEDVQQPSDRKDTLNDRLRPKLEAEPLARCSRGSVGQRVRRSSSSRCRARR